jgi:hypothetical protein
LTDTPVKQQIENEYAIRQAKCRNIARKNLQSKLGRSDGSCATKGMQKKRHIEEGHVKCKKKNQTVMIEELQCKTR